MDIWKPLPLPSGSYADETRPWTQQDIVNYLPTPAQQEGTATAIKYACVPGLNLFVRVGTGPHRGAEDVEGKLFVVSGTKLYQISVTGTATLIGTIPGVGFVSMTHNQIDGGNELLIGAFDTSYVYNTATGVLTNTGIALFSVDFLNQRFLGVDPLRRFWRYSGLASGTSWNDLDNEDAESSPDRIVGGKVSQSEWLVFGGRTIEVWPNNPNDTSAFPARGTVIEKGCANANTICRLDNTLYFLGDDLIVYKLQGYTPIPVSNKAQAEVFRQSNPDKAFAFTYQDHGYVIYYLTFQDGHTWGYDVTSQRWHRRESFGLDRWRLNTLFKWNNDWYGGDYSDGSLYRLDWGYALEGCELLPRRIRTGVLHSNGNRISIAGLRVMLATGGVVSKCNILISPEMADTYTNIDTSHQYVATDAIGATTFTIDSGSLPDGLTMSTAGLVTGTTETEGTFTFRVKAVDSTGTVGILDESVEVSPYYFAYQIEENGTSSARRMRTGYAKFNNFTEVFTAIATFDLTPVSPISGIPGFVMDGKLIMHAHNDNDSIAGSQKSGVYVLSSDGTSTLVQTDRWQISTSQFHDYQDIAKYDDSTVAVIGWDADIGDAVRLYALTYSGGTLTLVGSPLTISAPDDEHVLCMHNGALLVMRYQPSGSQFLKAYTFNGSVWSLAGTYGGSIPAPLLGQLDELKSDGSFIYLNNGMIFTYAAGTFTLVTQADVGNEGSRLGITPGYIMMLFNTTDLRLFAFNGSTATLKSHLAGTWDRNGSAATIPNIGTEYADYLLPVPDHITASHGGDFYWFNDLVSTIHRYGDLSLDNNSRATGVAARIVALDGPLG